MLNRIDAFCPKTRTTRVRWIIDEVAAGLGAATKLATP